LKIPIFVLLKSGKFPYPFPFFPDSSNNAQKNTIGQTIQNWLTETIIEQVEI